MKSWCPKEEWKGEDAILIGGGPSLKDFDFEQLKGRNTIGCNHAFMLGHDIVKILVFGDAQFWQRMAWNIQKFKGRIVNLAPKLSTLNHPRMVWMKRHEIGLHRGRDACGWNNSTGAAAIDLAILLGARRIFLLGYDLRREGRSSHWHGANPLPILDASFEKFKLGFSQIAAQLNRFPDVHIMNVTDGSSQLPYFTRIPFDTFLKYIPPQRRSECLECKERAKERLRNESNQKNAENASSVLASHG